MSSSARMSDLLTVSAGHRRAAQEIADCAQRGQCCAFLGPRLSGTSEVLQHVRSGLASDPLTKCVYLDLRDVKSSTQKEFFASLTEHVCAEAAAFGAKGCARLGKTVSSGAEFRACLKKCCARLRSNLVLVVDHLHIIPTDLVQALLTSLRAAYMDQDSSGPLFIPIVCGALSLATLTLGQSSPFANIARPVFIGGLDTGESREFIRMCLASAGAEVSSGAYDELLRAAEGDPRLIDRLCRDCVCSAEQRDVRQVTAGTVKRAVRHFVKNEAQRYEPVVEAVSLIESDPVLLRCILLLLEKGVVERRELALPLSADLDPLTLTGMVRKVAPDSFALKNGVYQSFLKEHFHPRYVGYLMSLVGRWDEALDCLEAGLEQGTREVRLDLLAATVNAMYAAQDLEMAASYLARGLAVGFGVQQARIWYAEPAEKVLRLVGKIGSVANSTLGSRTEIAMLDDSLEARSYRGPQSLRGQENQAGIERALPLLLTGTEAVGVVTLFEAVGERDQLQQRRHDLQLGAYLAQAARAMEEVHNRQEQLLRIARLEQERTAAELRMAHEIQLSFLPERPPTYPGWDIAADWHSARQVGGDFYDFVSVDESRLGLVIADVSDKGMAAALFMSLCRTLMRVSASQTRSPALALQRLNELIAAESRSDMFLTIFYGVLNLKTGQLTYASAGHPAPLLWRQRVGDVAPPGTLRALGTMLGVLPRVTLEERQVTLEPHDVLSLFTDGVTEPIDSQGTEFGEERLAGILRANHELPCSEIVARTHAAVWDYAGQRVQFDDYTLVTVKRTAL
ncbi:MAG TPA: PP2C family protein-serine/threonine phosphatase [Anaerolineae bacterium]|nr:PP2C family protein-serine/threonine phosphatase [Anaerolineae bacterium]